jgi:hypothetical protein
LFALIGLAAVGASGLALDGAAAYGHEREHHNAADAAALSATRYLAANRFDVNRGVGATAKAQDVARFNGLQIAEGDVTPVTNDGKEAISWAAAQGVKVRARADHRTFLLRAFGIGTVSVTTTATAAYVYPTSVTAFPMTLNLVEPHLGGQPPYRACFMIAGGISGPPPDRVNPLGCERNFGTLKPKCDPPITEDACLANAFANGVPVDRDAWYDAGDVWSLTTATRNAIQARIDASPWSYPDDPHCYAGNPRCVIALVTTGAFGNPQVQVHGFQPVFLAYVGKAPPWLTNPQPPDTPGSIWRDAVSLYFMTDFALDGSGESPGTTTPPTGDPPYDGAVYIKLID